LRPPHWKHGSNVPPPTAPTISNDTGMLDAIALAELKR